MNGDGRCEYSRPNVEDVIGAWWSAFFCALAICLCEFKSAGFSAVMKIAFPRNGSRIAGSESSRIFVAVLFLPPNVRIMRHCLCATYIIHSDALTRNPFYIEWHFRSLSWREDLVLRNPDNFNALLPQPFSVRACWYFGGSVFSVALDTLESN